MQVCTGIPIWITRPTPSIHNMNCRIRTIYPSTLSTPQTIRNTHNIIETTHLLCMIQMILDSTLLVSKIISINIVSMIKARTNLIYNTLDSTRLTRIMINGTDLDLSIVFIFQQVRDIKFFMVNARLMQTRIFKPNVT